MPACRVLYFREAILEHTQELGCDDLVEAAKVASATHPHLTAEIWWNGKKVAVIRPSWNPDPVIRESRPCS
jgi:hypothetical protein